jgi:hypothetical protein
MTDDVIYEYESALGLSPLMWNFLVFAAIACCYPFFSIKGLRDAKAG